MFIQFYLLLILQKNQTIVDWSRDLHKLEPGLQCSKDSTLKQLWLKGYISFQSATYNKDQSRVSLRNYLLNVHLPRKCDSILFLNSFLHMYDIVWLISSDWWNTILLNIEQIWTTFELEHVHQLVIQLEHSIFGLEQTDIEHQT